MTRILTIIALLFATPAWAMSSEHIILEGEILASSSSKAGTDLVVSYNGKIYHCLVNLNYMKCWRPKIEKAR